LGNIQEVLGFIEKSQVFTVTNRPFLEEVFIQVAIYVGGIFAGNYPEEVVVFSKFIVEGDAAGQGIVFEAG
jgi:hypothetical protein